MGVAVSGSRVGAGEFVGLGISCIVLVGIAANDGLVSVATGLDGSEVARSPSLDSVSIGIVWGASREIGSEPQPATMPAMIRVTVIRK